MDAGLPGVEFEAHGQVAPAVEKNEEKPQKGRKIDKFRPFSCRKVKFVGFPGSKSDRLLVPVRFTDTGLRNRSMPSRGSSATLPSQRYPSLLMIIMIIDQ